jgi:hypothetical protein
MKDAYYFSHDSNARYDPKILSMVSIYGMAGYGWYWVIIEVLREQENYKFNITKEHSYNAIAMQLYSDCNATKKFITDCIDEFELFISDGEYFWSESLLERMEILANKRQKMQENAAKRWSNQAQNNNGNAIAMQKQCKSNASKVKESKVKESKEYIYPYRDIVELYNSTCPTLSKVALKLLSDSRKNAIRLRWIKFAKQKDKSGNEFGMRIFEELFTKAHDSDFLSGRNGKWTSCNFDWLLNEKNLVKVLEGTYDNR